MKLGISTALKHTTPQKWAESLARAGCSSVVFPVDYRAKESLIAGYQKAAEEYGLQIAEVGIWKNAIAKDSEEQKEAMDYSIGQLRLADRLGASCCVNVAGSAGERWDGPYRENFSSKTWDRTVRMIQEVIDEVKPQRTFFTIEPMPWMVPTGPEEYARLLEAVGRERFAVHMDIVNMMNTPERYFFPERFAEQCFALLGHSIKSCHLKDVRLLQGFTFQLEECACGQGSFCLERYAELANEVSPDMPMLIEHLSTEEEYLESLHYVKKRLQGFVS